MHLICGVRNPLLGFASFFSLPHQHVIPYLTTAPLNILSIILVDKAENEESIKKMKQRSQEPPPESWLITAVCAQTI